MGKYSFVLSDTLYKQYYLFKEHQDYDKDILLHLLKFRCGEFLTNTRQLDDIGIGDRVSKSLYDSLKHARLTKQTLEELARKTDYKLILCDDRTDYPYVNIMSDQISSHITGCFYRNAHRDKAIRHIRALCQDAEKNMPVRSIPECLQGCLEIDFAEQKSRTCLSFEAFE